MKTLADRFRRWYAHERDCNSKIIQMLSSVPKERRSDPAFERALAKATHLITAREIWLKRLGHYDAAPAGWDVPTAALAELGGRFARIEGAWVKYLDTLDDAELARKFEFGRVDGRWRWDVEGVLTQVHGHAWYHRGQIASIVASLGGKAVDTDYIFWAGVERLT
jgi:uncharacterized damage-inducible protein DinB